MARANLENLWKLVEKLPKAVSRGLCDLPDADAANMNGAQSGG